MDGQPDGRKGDLRKRDSTARIVILAGLQAAANCKTLSHGKDLPTATDYRWVAGCAVEQLQGWVRVG